MTCTLDASAFLQALFGMPATEVLAKAFGIGVTVPLTAYLVAYMCGLLVNMFKN